MNLIDLFAGIGGFSLAAHWMGWKTAAFIEKDPFCQKVLRKNFGTNIEIHDDIFTFSGEPFRERVDIVTGGFPCQPFSAAGKQRGKEDDRYLFPEMLRVISEVRPRWVVAENVRRLLGNNHGQTFEEICSHLEGKGYEVITFCIPASSFSAPHRRERLWIIAHDAEHTRRMPGQTATVQSGNAGLSANTNCDASNSRGNGFGRLDRFGQDYETTRTNQGEGIQRQRIRPESGRNNSVTPNTGDTGLQRDKLVRASGEGTGPPRSITERFENENWYEAATRFCRMDDGIPDRMDRIKSLGNTVLPLIPYEIFLAIAQAEKEHFVNVVSAADREHSKDAKEESRRSQQSSI